MINKIYTVTKGRRSELLMMAMLLENGFNVFEELADAEGIDCGILGQNDVFYPIQIKSRADFYDGNLVSIHHFPINLLVIIYDEKSKDYWIIPGNDYKSLANILNGEGIAYYRLAFKKGKPTLLDIYKNQKGIQLLKNMISPSSL